MYFFLFFFLYLISYFCCCGVFGFRFGSGSFCCSIWFCGDGVLRLRSNFSIFFCCCWVFGFRSMCSIFFWSSWPWVFGVGSICPMGAVGSMDCPRVLRFRLVWYVLQFHDVLPPQTVWSPIHCWGWTPTFDLWHKMWKKKHF